MRRCLIGVACYGEKIMMAEAACTGDRMRRLGDLCRKSMSRGTADANIMNNRDQYGFHRRRGNSREIERREEKK